MHIDPDHLISVTDFARKTSRVIADVADNGETYTILKDNKLTATVVSFERYRAMQERLAALTTHTRELVIPRTRTLDSDADIDVPTMTGFPLEVGVLDQVPFVQRHWLHSEGKEALDAPIGVDTDNRVVRLDIYEPAAGGTGPHGCVTGGTADDRAKVVAVLLSALALEHSPDDVVLAVADYSGVSLCERHFGGAGIPHAVLQTTDPDSPDFADALEAEIQARRDLLHRHRIADFRTYRQHRRDGEYHLPALPALVVVVAESETVQEDFDAMLRVGRALGIHFLVTTEELPDSGDLSASLGYSIDIDGYARDSLLGALVTGSSSSGVRLSIPDPEWSGESGTPRAPQTFPIAAALRQAATRFPEAELVSTRSED
jgi:S-DNA-T family DNA segregation ATPase FtsK/SpoIIIE